MPAHVVAAAVIGGRQAGLATAFYLRRAGLTPDRAIEDLTEAVTAVTEFFSRAPRRL